jgi:hypothetical protein
VSSLAGRVLRQCSYYLYKKRHLCLQCEQSYLPPLDLYAKPDQTCNAQAFLPTAVARHLLTLPIRGRMNYALIHNKQVPSKQLSLIIKTADGCLTRAWPIPIAHHSDPQQDKRLLKSYPCKFWKTMSSFGKPWQKLMFLTQLSPNLSASIFNVSRDGIVNSPSSNS